MVTRVSGLHLYKYALPSTGAAATRHATLKQIAPQPRAQGGQILWPAAAVVALIMVAQMAPYAGPATIVALSLWACRNTRCALQALAISVLVTFANPGLVGEQPLVGLFKWVLLFVSLGTILASWRYQPKTISKWFVCFALFVAVALGLAISVSRDLALSL